MINRLTIQILESIVDNLSPASNYTGGLSSPYTMHNIKKVRDAIKILEELKLFPYATELIKNTALYLTPEDSINTNHTEQNNIILLLDQLRFRILGVIEASDDYQNQDTSTSLIFKYHTLENFSELEKFSRDLKQSIEIPLQILDSSGTGVNIISIEEGSLIVTISFGAGLLLVTKIIDLAFRYKMKWEEAKRNELYNQSLELDVSLKKTLTNAVQQQVKTYLQKESELLLNENTQITDNEKVEIIKNSILTLNELLSRGMTITPALNAPTDIKTQFAEFTTLDNQEQKQLTEADEI